MFLMLYITLAHRRKYRQTAAFIFQRTKRSIGNCWLNKQTAGKSWSVRRFSKYMDRLLQTTPQPEKEQVVPRLI